MSNILIMRMRVCTEVSFRNYTATDWFNSVISKVHFQAPDKRACAFALITRVSLCQLSILIIYWFCTSFYKSTSVNAQALRWVPCKRAQISSVYENHLYKKPWFQFVLSCHTFVMWITFNLPLWSSPAAREMGRKVACRYLIIVFKVLSKPG